MAAPGYYGYFGHVADTESDNNNSNLAVDELFDFPKEDESLNDTFFDSSNNINAGSSNDSSAVTAVDSCNSSVSGTDHFLSGRSFSDTHFSGELCVPYDDLAELEWLSNFVEDSFSSDSMHNLQLIPTVQTATSSPQTATTNPSPPFFPSEGHVPGKARSKRSRAAPNDWSSRLLPLSSPTICSLRPSPKRRPDPETSDPLRKCLHCGSDKTPQWRTGPMGPKTLCNACGVRHKSGRLVPEYRPAASPTFVSAKHSNSHRKVLELRRQKEMQRQHEFMSHGSIYGSDDYMIRHHHHNHHNGPDYRHMI